MHLESKVGVIKYIDTFYTGKEQRTLTWFKFKNQKPHFAKRITLKSFLINDMEDIVVFLDLLG